MSLSLLQSYTAMSNNGLSVPFGASGGTAPYTYSVLPGGAGGTIDSSTGMYTSPVGSVGTDVIQVTDSAIPSNTASGSVLVGPAILLVCDIIQTAMGLQNGQVYLYNQKYDVPIDDKLYIAVGVNDCHPFGNRPEYTGGSSALTAVQTVNMLANLSIHIFSRGPTALYQKEQVLLALSSPYAQQQMELNSFYVAPITTSFVNLSDIDGAAIPYHYNLSVNIQYFSTLNTTPSYFDSFGSVSVTDEA